MIDCRNLRVVLVEDHEITRLGLKKMLEQVCNASIVAEESSGQGAISSSLELQPDLVLMDIGLPDIDGIEATRSIKAALGSRVIVITSHELDEDIFAAINAGADAYCLKGITASQLGNAVASVMEGAVWLDPGIARRIVGMMDKKSEKRVEEQINYSQFRLSEKEKKILVLLVEGCSNQQMADRLFLSPETIKTHMRHIMEKLRVSDRTQAAVKAVREGLV